ncbi:MAG TPA: DnaD domain protein [Clostridia bacterium]|nr:DnaD domain protein [Clostridia bacterium]
MRLCSFSETYHMFDVTPVENLFIQEFMLKAPGDFVKVYIYGLKQCYHLSQSENTVDSFSRALCLEAKVVENAFYYWERQGIMEVKKDDGGQLSIEYLNIKDMLYNSCQHDNKSLYHYKDFNQNLQTIFGKRLLTPQEYLRVYDWIEILLLPAEVVLMMVQFYLSKKSSRLSINYLDKVAESWAKDGINTLQKAEEYIEQYESCYQETIAVLKYLGIHRTPSKAELDLYKKWQDLWGFPLNAVLEACKETTKIQSPNMGYLDKILENLHSLGLLTQQDIKSYFSSRDTINDSIKDVLFNLGYKSTAPTPEHQSLYIKWTTSWQMDHDVILLACKQLIRKKTRIGFSQVDGLLAKWKERGFTRSKDIKNYLRHKKILINEIRTVLERAGDNREVTTADQRVFIRWTKEWNISYELILLAAEYSTMAENKLPFINKILNNWYDSGITSVKEAKADHERHTQGGQGIGSESAMRKQVDFNQFEQHSYTDEDLEHLFEDLENV